jgi:GDP-L-fucose synthase
MNYEDKIYIAGHQGLVGSAIVRELSSRGFNNLITRSHQQLDLTRQTLVQDFFSEQAINYVILAAGKVGGIHANNTFPADFIYQNIMIEANVIDAAFRSNVERLLFLGSTCIYPGDAQQPIKEEALLTGTLEPTNEPYALAKIAGIKLCESYNRQYGTDYRSVMPTNLYGINDNFHNENSHVIPALISRFHKAKIHNEVEVEVWGSGQALREFLYVDDMAQASIFVLELDKNIYQASVDQSLSHLNVGIGRDITIRELAETIKSVVGFRGNLNFNNSKPDGTKRKLVDVTKLQKIGWTAKTDLRAGLTKTYEWYVENFI